MAFSDFKDDKNRFDDWRGFLNEAEDEHAELQKIEGLVDGARSETLYIDFDYADLVEGPTWVFQAVISVAVPDEMRTQELDWRAEHTIEKEFERSAADYVDLTSEKRLPKPDFNAQHLNHGELQISWTVYGIEKLEGFIKDVEQMDDYFDDPSVRAKLFAPLRKQAELTVVPLSEEKQRKFSDFKNDKKRMDNWRGFLNEGHDCASHEGQTHEEWESQLEEVYVDPDEPSQDDDLNELMRLIREEIEVVLSDAEAKEFFGDDALSSDKLQEENSGKCPPDGCVQEREKGWVVISNKTGQCWGRSKQGADADCTYYDSREDAESALGAYHAGGG